jgi:predicted nucleic-acid-binding Zn-ribbon protein
MGKMKDICPKCGSPDVLPISYGEPGPKMQADARNGKIILGGCIIRHSNPLKACKKCGNRW